MFARNEVEMSHLGTKGIFGVPRSGGLSTLFDKPAGGGVQFMVGSAGGGDL